nr:hypothetical protein [Tanacetum cinerariifolium]
AQTTTNDAGTSTTLIPGPITTKEKAQKKNDVKARSMLLMALPNEHLMKFNQYKDVKTLFAAIQTRFGGFRRFTNEVNTTYGVSTANTQANPASTQVNTANIQVSTSNLSNATVYAFLASQPNGSQLAHEDLVQIHEDDLKEMDLKWQLALLCIRTKRNRKPFPFILQASFPSFNSIFHIPPRWDTTRGLFTVDCADLEKHDFGLAL